MRPMTAASRRVPLDKRKRTETSCDKCKSRKQKCKKEPGQDACQYCTAHHIECQTTQPRKKRLYGSVESLGNRLALLESLVKGLLPEADVSNLDDMRQLGISLGIALPESAGGDASGDQASVEGAEAEEPLSLLPDQQGQVQYIGASSSFAFHLKLRALCGVGPVREFVLFGKNAAEPSNNDANGPRSHINDSHPILTPRPSSGPLFDLPSAVLRPSNAKDAATLELLITAYFQHVNPDFPVLYEPSFREAYQAWLIEPTKADLAWQCGFLCMLLLGRRVASANVPDGQEKQWWTCVQTLLPVVIFTSSVTAVQTLLLAALHLHNTNHRDACWNLTGTAIRIAFAIGLNQDKASTSQAPLAREVRKRLWWTLYAFEQMQVSSYDRPSAIEHHVSKNSHPNERILGSAANCPPDYCCWFNRLTVYLGSACRAPKHVKTSSSASDESYAGPLSPAAGVLRDLERWKTDLPQYLRLEALDTSAPAFRRPILLMHALYHYTVIVLCRPASLSRATTLSKENRDSPNMALRGMADSCTGSGRALAKILLKLEAIGQLDVHFWFDMWYALTSGSVLVLDVVCHKKSGDPEASESLMLIQKLADLVRRHIKDSHTPGTIAKFASIVPELQSMAENMVEPPPVVPSQVQPEPVPASQTVPSQQQVAVPAATAPFAFSHPNTNLGAYVFADNVPGQYFGQSEFAVGAPYSNTRFDRSTQMQFMDFSVNNIHDWNWADLGHMPQNLPPGSASGPHR